jgi:hypothetical protein
MAFASILLPAMTGEFAAIICASASGFQHGPFQRAIGPVLLNARVFNSQSLR